MTELDHNLVKMVHIVSLILKRITTNDVDINPFQRMSLFAIILKNEWFLPSHFLLPKLSSRPLYFVCDSDS